MTSLKTLLSFLSSMTSDWKRESAEKVAMSDINFDYLFLHNRFNYFNWLYCKWSIKHSCLNKSPPLKLIWLEKCLSEHLPQRIFLLIRGRLEKGCWTSGWSLGKPKNTIIFWGNSSLTPMISTGIIFNLITWRLCILQNIQ